MAQRLSESALTDLKLTEALRLVAYPDGGRWAIGYGHNPTGKNRVSKGDTISVAEAERLLMQDVADAERAVQQATHGLDLNQGEYDALVDYTYNRGAGSFQRSGIVEALKTGDKDKAAEILRTTGTTLNGETNQGLVERRRKGAAAFSGEKVQPTMSDLINMDLESMTASQKDKGFFESTLESTNKKAKGSKKSTIANSLLQGDSLFATLFKEISNV